MVIVVICVICVLNNAMSHLHLKCHFIIGKTDITWMMLDAGAETDAVNSVGRTAAQMAAFVGKHRAHHPSLY